MNREPLDDTIDRVAREMTIVTRRAIGVGLRDRIREQRQPRFALVLAGAAAAVVATVVIVSWWTTAPASRPLTHAVAIVDSGRVAPLVPSPHAVERSLSVIAAVPVGEAVRSVDVPPLRIEPLGLEAIADVAPLSVDDILVSEIDGDPREEYR